MGDPQADGTSGAGQVGDEAIARGVRSLLDWAKEWDDYVDDWEAELIVRAILASVFERET